MDWNSAADKVARAFYSWAVVKVLPFSIKPALTPPQCWEEHLVTTGWKWNCRQAIYFSLTRGERNALSLGSGDKYFFSLPCFFLHHHVCSVAQSYPTLCDPMDSSLPGFSAHGIFPRQEYRVGCHFLLQGRASYL